MHRSADTDVSVQYTWCRGDSHAIVRTRVSRLCISLCVRVLCSLPQERTFQATPLSSVVVRQPRSSAQSCTTSYLQLVVFTTTAALRRRFFLAPPPAPPPPAVASVLLLADLPPFASLRDDGMVVLQLGKGAALTTDGSLSPFHKSAPQRVPALPAASSSGNKILPRVCVTHIHKPW